MKNMVLRCSLLIGCLLMPGVLLVSAEPEVEHSVPACRCLDQVLIESSESCDLAIKDAEKAAYYRCAKCKARDQEKRQKLAQTILASVAQFFQGIVILAHGGKDVDDKLKIEQGILMAQAVGNIIYQAQEYDRHYAVELENAEPENNEGAPSRKRRSAFNGIFYKFVQHELVDFIVQNPECFTQVVVPN